MRIKISAWKHGMQHGKSKTDKGQAGRQTGRQTLIPEHKQTKASVTLVVVSIARLKALFITCSSRFDCSLLVPLSVSVLVASIADVVV